MDDSPVRHGDILAGKYRVESVLGAGGMGVVVAAVHLELGQRVALKFVLPHAAENPEIAARFLREARAAVKIDSEHVARILDVGRLETGAPYMVMEYLEGSDLSLHARGEALPIGEAVDFALQACAAMAVAHAAGIIHRDLKPANLFVTKRPDGSPLLKVLDFGISKMSVMDAPAGLTHTSAMMGSPLYMSPEQAQSARDVDPRTDIWSLGVILYELLTGELPFPGHSLGEVIAALMTATPRPVRALRPSVPVGLELAVMCALEKPLERRFANIGELSAALVDFAPPGSRVLHERVSGVMSRAGLSSAPPPMSAQARADTRPPLVSATDTNWTARDSVGKRSVSAPVMLGATLVSAAVLGAVLWRHRPSPNDARTLLSASAAPAQAVHAVAPSAAEASAIPAPSAAAAPSASAAPLAAHHEAARLPETALPAQAAKLPATPAAAASPPHPKKNPLSIDFR